MGEGDEIKAKQQLKMNEEKQCRIEHRENEEQQAIAGQQRTKATNTRKDSGEGNFTKPEQRTITTSDSPRVGIEASSMT